MSLHVCHLSSVHPVNDVRIFHKECVSLVNAGFEVDLVAIGPGETHYHSGVRVHPVAPSDGRLRRATVGAAGAVRRAVSTGAPLIHFHDPELIPFGVGLAAAGRLVVYDAHESLAKSVMSKPYLPRFARRAVSMGANTAEWAMAQAASAIVTATPAIARQFPASKTTTIQNFPLLGELAPRDVSYADRPNSVIYTGGITAPRGAVEMVEAMALADHGPRLTLVGSFKSVETERKARSSRGWDRVDFLGWLPRTDLQAVFATARVGLVVFHPEPNHIEAMPNKLFEYMSAGLPVVASDFPLWRSIVEGAGCGLLVDPTDPGDIASSVDWLLTHPEEAMEMGARGRKAVEARYNWGVESPKLVDLCHRLLG